MKAINCRLVPVAGYLLNVCMLARNDLENLDKIVKNILKNEEFYRKKTSGEKLCKKNKDGGRRLGSFINVYKDIKVRVVYYMATSPNDKTTNEISKPRS